MNKIKISELCVGQWILGGKVTGIQYYPHTKTYLVYYGQGRTTLIYDGCYVVLD